MVEFKAPTPEAIKFIADNMRKADADEVWASNRFTPLEALKLSVKKSNKSAVAYDGDIPLVVFGIVSIGFLSDVGVPWLLGTEQATKYVREFAKYSQGVVDEMMDNHTRLVNHVYVNNKVSIRWLKRLGFIIEDPKPLKTTGEMFHRFYMER